MWQKETHSAHNDSTQLPYRYLLLYLPGGSTRREVGHRVHLGLTFWGKGGRSGMVPFEKGTVVSYRLYIALSLRYL